MGGMKRAHCDLVPLEAKRSKDGSLEHELELTVPDASYAHDAIIMAASMPSALDSAAGSVSASSRAMLRAMAPACLVTPPGQRHHYQVAVGEMLRGVLLVAERDTGHQVEEASARVSQAEEALGAARNGKASAGEALGSSVASFDNAKSSFRGCNMSLQEDHRAFELAVELQRQATEEVHRTASLRTVLEQVYREHVAPVIAETCEDLGLHVDVIASSYGKAKLDESLAIAFSVAARKQPQDRSNFDHLVLRQLDAEYNKRIQELTTEVEAAGPTITAHEEAVAKASATLDEARQRQQDSAAMLRGAELDHHTAAAEVWAKDQAVDAAHCQLQDAKAAQAKAEDGLTDFRRGPLAKLQVLLDREDGPASKNEVKVGPDCMMTNGDAPEPAGVGEQTADLD